MVRDLCIKSGLMVRAIRDTIVMSPPLIISHAEIEQVVETIRSALDEAAPALRAMRTAA
jgi:putrescine aminotransferase